MESKMLNWFRDYLNTTPLETIKIEWKEIQEQFPEGVKAFEYLGLFEGCCNEYDYQNPPNSEVKTPNNMTPTFRGLFFVL